MARVNAAAFAPPTDAEWDALVARATLPRFYAVRTTGIVCRAGCPARTPHRRNVTVAPSVQAAKAAGFRACLRCRPV